ncbi:MAG: acylphosphatase, partial [Candidatus Paceibacterota bacterium]
VENLPDGKVSIEAWGELAPLKDFIKNVSKGSRLSRVDNIAEVWDNKDYISDERQEFRLIH